MRYKGRASEETLRCDFPHTVEIIVSSDRLRSEAGDDARLPTEADCRDWDREKIPSLVTQAISDCAP